MKWITGIELNNYRAFASSGKIEIPFKNQTLIFGENGSGKTSFYHALKDFLNSSINRRQDFILNRFEKEKGNDQGWIKIKLRIDNEENEYSFSDNTDRSNFNHPDFILANKLRGFLDYKKLLKVYALDVDEDKTPNFFDFIIRDLLGEHRINDPAGGTITTELFYEYSLIRDGLLNYPSHSAKYKNAENKLNNFDYTIRNLLIEVFENVNVFLDEYFENNVEVGILYNSIGLKPRKKGKKKEMFEELNLKISFCGKEIEYRTFLNEARLSALAVCIYLASIKAYKPPEIMLKVLYLDDVFIGMDTSNRYPLLKIIHEEFIKMGYQVFISTYDKEWFEMAKHWFEVKECPIKPYEFYIESSDEKNVPDKPVIIPTKGNYEKAEAYFKKKDYPAAGNYLRKECEFILKNLLLNEYKINSDGSPVKELENLLNALVKQFSDLNIEYPKELLDSLKIYRKSFLNPSSHDDVSSPLFKKEIQDDFILVSKLRAIPKPEKKLVVTNGQLFTYNNSANNYSAEIELCDSIFKVSFNGQITTSNYKFRVNDWQWNGVQFAGPNGIEMPVEQRINFCRQERFLQNIFIAIYQSTGIEIPDNLEDSITIGNRGTLYDLLK